MLFYLVFRAGDKTARTTADTDRGRGRSSKTAIHPDGAEKGKTRERFVLLSTQNRHP
jgi:hypothetical protein